MITKQSLRPKLLFFIFATVTLLLAFLCQQYVLWPVEQTLLSLDPTNLAIASLIFLPHGFKVLFMTLAGIESLLPIFIAQYIGGIAYGLTTQEAVPAALIGTLAVFLPFVVLRTQRWIWPSKDTNRNLLQKLLIIGICSSILNSTLITIYHGHIFQDGISLRFFVGDLVGTVAVFGILIALRKTLFRAVLRQRVG